MKGFQTRPGLAKQASAPPAVKVVLGGDSDRKLPVTFHPGVYEVKCTSADVVQKRTTGTVSLALTFVEAESCETMNLPPMWLGGGNSSGGTSPALDDNRWLVSQLSRAAGKDPKGLDLTDAAKLLVDKDFTVEIGTDQINGRECNRLVNVAVETE